MMTGSVRVSGRKPKVTLPGGRKSRNGAEGERRDRTFETGNRGGGFDRGKKKISDEFR